MWSVIGCCPRLTLRPRCGAARPEGQDEAAPVSTLTKIGQCTLRACPLGRHAGTGKRRPASSAVLSDPGSCPLPSAFPPSMIVDAGSRIGPGRYRVWPWKSSHQRSPPTSPSGPAPRVLLRPGCGFAVRSPVSMSAQSSCHRRATSRRERGQKLAAGGAPVVSAAWSPLLPLGWARLSRPCLRRGQLPRGSPSPPAAGCCLRAHP